MATYTLEEAKAYAAEKGIEWTPGLEAALRRDGKIVDAPPPAPKPTVPEWQAAIGELIGRATGGMAGTSGGMIPAEALSAYQRANYGSSAGDQLGAGVVSGLTARNVDLGVPAPTTGIGRFASGFGQGVGMGAAMLPAGRGVGMATQGIASPLLRAAATGAAGFGAYEGAAPAESLAERGLNVLKGGVIGGVTGGVPAAPGVRDALNALPFLRPLLDYGMFTGVGGVEGMAAGQPAGEAFKRSAEGALPMMAGGMALHAAANAGRGAPTDVEGKQIVFDEARQFQEAGMPPGRGGKNRPQSGFYRDQDTGKMMRPYIEGEPNSIPLVDYLNGKIDEVAVAKAAADMTDPSGQVIRQILQDGKVGDLNPASVQVTDRGRTLRAAGGGDFMNPLQQHTQGVGRLAEMVRERMEYNLSKEYLNALTSNGIKRNSPDAEVLSRISELATDYGKHPRDLAASGDGAAIMAKAQNPEAVFKTFDEVQKVEAKLGQILNESRRVMDAEPIELRKYHQSRIEKQYSLVGRGGRDFLNALEQRTRPRDTPIQSVGPNEVWSAREQQRGQTLLKPDQISRDPFYIAENYVRDVSRTFSGRVGMKQGENVAKLVRQLAKTHEGSDPLYATQLYQTADAISAITQMAYNGKLIGVSGAVKDALDSSRPGQVVRITDQLISKAFNQSRYIANLRFMFGTQWTSLLMAAGQDRVTPDMLARATQEALSPRLRDEYNLSYAHWVKTRNAGSIIHENDMTSGAIKNPLREAGRSRVAKVGDSIKNAAIAPTSKLEDYVGRMAYAIGEQIGMKAGFTGEKLDAFKSSTVELTQSLFDRANRASLLSTPILRTAMPAQGYNFDYWNTNLYDIRKGQLGPRGKMTNAQKTEALARVMFLQAASNAIYSMFGSQEKDAKGKLKDAAWGATGGSIPYLSQGLGLTFSKGRGFQAQWVEENVKAIDYAFKGEWDEALATAVGNLLPGGLQMQRYVEANQKVEEGVIPGREKLWAELFGWQWTPSGKRYLRQRAGKETAADRAYRPDSEQRRKASAYRREEQQKARDKQREKDRKKAAEDREYRRNGGR